MSAAAPSTLTTALGQASISSLLFFFVIVGVTLAVIYWAARRTAAEPPAASVGAVQNGLALAGEYMSAASFLGISGLVAVSGYDGMIYATGWLVGWPALMFLLAEPLRNLGRFTIADVISFRLRQRPVRVASAVGGIPTLLFYAIAQMVGAGTLIQLMFGMHYAFAEILVGVIMLGWIIFGGVAATAWVQIVKAVLLLAGVTLLTVLVLARFDFDPVALYAQVSATYGQAALEPGGLVRSPVEAVSLGLALMFGLLGLPHVIQRFFTMPDARAARRSGLYATGLIGYFYLVIPVVGFGASVLVGRDVIVRVDRGANMAAPLVAELLGGTPLLGFVGAVAFATILAVVSGLTLAASTAFAHDLYVSAAGGGPGAEKQKAGLTKAVTLVFGVAAVLLGVVFRGQNVAVLVGLAFAMAASASFPPLLLSIVWRRFSTSGAVWCTVAGAVTSVGLVVLSRTVWVQVLGHGRPLVELENPAIVSMPAAFLVGIVVSLVTREPEARARYDEQKARSYLGAA